MSLRFGTPLTDREREVLDSLAIGMTPKQVGDHLRMPHSTVETHLGKAKVRLGALTTYHLVYLYALHRVRERFVENGHSLDAIPTSPLVPVRG